MDLSIIIVNYNTPQLMIDCLESIFKFPSSIHFETIIVDNNSSDDSRSIIENQFPQVRWIQMNYNAGFARANNEGIRQSFGSVILLLNSDTIVLDNAIEICYKKFLASPYAACGVQLLNHDLTPQTSGFYAVKGGLNFLLQLPYVGALITFIGNSLRMNKPNVPVATGTVEVDWINGAFLMVKRRSIETAGSLDEDFFLYAEETEWCSRLKKTGNLCIYGDIHILHLQAGTSVQTFQSKDKNYKNIFDKKGLQIMVSTFVRIRKEFGVAWFLFILFFFVLEVPAFLIGIFFSFLFAKKESYSLSDFFGYVKNVGRTIKLSPAIISNKPYFYKVL